MICEACGQECVLDEVGIYWCPLCGLGYNSEIEPEDNIILGYN